MTLTATPLTARQLNRATLARQLLLRREKLGVVDAVHRIVALQAQEPASPYLALWNRVKGFDADDLDAAFTDRSVIKASLMRVAMHAVGADDYPAFQDAMQPTLRAARLNDARFRLAGLSIAEADALIPDVRAFASTPRTTAQVEAWLDERLGPPPRGRAWWAFRHYGPFVHAPVGKPWSFPARSVYRAADEHITPSGPETSLQHLVFRYLEGFGPASVQDIAQFTMLKRPLVRAAVEALGDRLVLVSAPDGAKLLDVPNGRMPVEETPAPPRLLGMWDEVLLAYVDRSRTIPPEVRKLVIRINGDVLPTLLVDGYVAGVWRPTDGGIEASAFETLTSETWKGLAVEAADLMTFLADRDPNVYARYGHWWKSMPSAERRVLPG